MLQIHPQAGTTPAIRAEIARSTKPASVLPRGLLTVASLLLCTISGLPVMQGIPQASARTSEGSSPWLRTPATRAAVDAHITSLQAQLLGGGAATSVLDRWCADHHLAPPAALTADKIAARLVPARASLARLLGVGVDDAIGYRRVRLRCADHVVSTASLWYVPDRLGSAINAQLTGSNIPFGRAAAPLGFHRVSHSSRRLWTATKTGSSAMPRDLFALSAKLILPNGQPLAYVEEVYQRGLLDFPPVPD